MKYDEQVFNLSIDAYDIDESAKSNPNEEIKKKQDKLLKILLSKFQNQLNAKKNMNDGILRVTFKRYFWSDFNDGYLEIDDLVKSNNFDSFASDYCMYIGNIEDGSDVCYYEIIWDYKTYYEQLKVTKEGKERINTIKNL